MCPLSRLCITMMTVAPSFGRKIRNLHADMGVQLLGPRLRAEASSWRMGPSAHCPCSSLTVLHPLNVCSKCCATHLRQSAS